MAKPLSEYARKRNFDITSEPSELADRKQTSHGAKSLSFVVQKHEARDLQRSTTSSRRYRRA